MKKILYISIIVILTISLSSCNDDFLTKKNQQIYQLKDTLNLNNKQEYVDTSVQLSTNINSDYSIFMQPKWLSFKSMHGKITDGNAPLYFSILKEEMPTGYETQYGTIVLEVSHIGLISLTVAYSNFGSPTLQFSPSSIDFKSIEFQSLIISNTSEGILNWKITGIPEWLSLSVTSGSLSYRNSINITVSLNFDIIPTGEDLSEIMQINSNSINGVSYVTVNVPASVIIPPDVRQIEGIVTDAEYSYESGIMAICTKLPNSLIIFNTTTNESKTLSFYETPVCISLSADGHSAVIGFLDSLIGDVNIDNPEITNYFYIDCIPYDIVLGENGWCYITPTKDQWVKLRSMYLGTGEIVTSLNQSKVYERTVIKKVPGKPYMVGNRTTLIPDGLLIFDLTSGFANDTITYYHESIGNFWISKDGTRLYTSIKNVYNLPEYDKGFHLTLPSESGRIESERGSICALDECPAINSVFVTSSYYSYRSGNSSLIEQFSTTSFNKIKTYNLSQVYLKENGMIKIYETSAWYIFINKEGTNLYALKNLREDYNKDYWTIETILTDAVGN